MAKSEIPKVMTVAETASLLRVNPRVIYGMIQRRELRGIKVGRLFRIPVDQIESLLRGQGGSGSGGRSRAEELSAEDLRAIQRGLDDIQAGRVVTLEEYEQKRGL